MFSQTKFRDQRLTRFYQLFSEMTTGSIWRTFSNHLFESNGREAKKHLKLYSFQFTKVLFFFSSPLITTTHIDNVLRMARRQNRFP